MQAIAVGASPHCDEQRQDMVGRRMVVLPMRRDGDSLHAKRLHASTTYAFLAMDVYAFGEESVAV